MKSFTAVGNLENTSKVDVTEFWLLTSSRTTSSAPKAVKDLEREEISISSQTHEQHNKRSLYHRLAEIKLMTCDFLLG